ncbi:MAG TPA: T9SS type A sorting domain-containing protein [Bacteroidia bacterium]|nr:T9SS type A sorting domain-containing protein [Bacteroidia bacterium]
MKKIFTLLTVLSSSLIINAQSIAPQVIASAGEFYSNISGSVSWTLGEPMGETYASTNNMLTQGFQQPDDFGTGISSIPGVDADVYPNPTADAVMLQFDDKANGLYIIEVFNTLGQQMSSTQFTATPSAKTTVNLVGFADGIYFITVRKADGSETSTFKITKNS